MSALKAYRQKINELLSAKDVKAALVDMGVAPDMATTLSKGKGLSSARSARVVQRSEDET